MNGCPRGFLFHEAVYHPQRITHPLIRTGERGSGEFRRASWDEALDLVARRLARIRDTRGPEAIMRIGGSGACRGALHNTATVPMRFFGLFGGYTDTVGSYSSQATSFVKPYMYGTKYVGSDVRTLLDSRMVILWGFNAADTRFGPETESILREVKKRGIPIVVIDPRRTRTVKRYDAEWLPIFPGSDAALMLAILHVILEEGLEDRDFIEEYGSGFDQLETHVNGQDGTPAKTPEWAATRCGLPASVIRDFARRYGASKPAALLPGLSIQRTIGGEEADRLGGVLQLALGNVGIPGGSAGTGQWNKTPGPRCGSLPVPPNPADRPGRPCAVPVYQWPDAVLGGTAAGWPSDIGALYTVGGNYLIQGSDIAKNIRAVQATGFVVTHDYFLTDTARYSDVILPTTTFVEREDIIFGSTNHLLYNRKAIEPIGEARDDWDIFAALADRLGFGEEFTGGLSTTEWLDRFLDESEIVDVKEFKETGLYAGDDQCRVGLSRFIADPQSFPLQTESGKIEVACPAYERAGGTRIPTYRDISETAALRLVTPHDRMRNNSQFDNVEAFAKLIDNTVWIHPDDAAIRKIANGDEVVLAPADDDIRSAGNGSLSTARAFARVTTDIMPGVLSWNQGAWLNRAPDGSLSNPNALTSTEPTMPSLGSRTHSVRVTVALRERDISDQ